MYVYLIKGLIQLHLNHNIAELKICFFNLHSIAEVLPCAVLKKKRRYINQDIQYYFDTSASCNSANSQAAPEFLTDTTAFFCPKAVERESNIHEHTTKIAGNISLLRKSMNDGKQYRS